MTSSCISGSIRVEKSRKYELLYHPICLKFGMRGNFEMLITRRRPKWKLENVLSKKVQFSTDFSQNYDKHSSTILLTWRQWMFNGTSLYSK